MQPFWCNDRHRVHQHKYYLLLLILITTLTFIRKDYLAFKRKKVVF